MYPPMLSWKERADMWGLENRVFLRTRVSFFWFSMVNDFRFI